MSLDIPNIIIPDCDLKQFEKIASLNSRFLRMNLIEGQLEIIMPPLPVHYDTGDNEFEIIGQVYKWCEANESLVGKRGTSQSAFRLLRLENPDSPDKPTILSPNAAVILKARFLKIIKYKDITFPQVAPNFIIELRSSSDSPQSLHQKMIRWANAGVDVGKLMIIDKCLLIIFFWLITIIMVIQEGISIDLITDPPEVRIYTINPDTNKAIWKSWVKPDQVKSEVLRG
ncbi:13559_t:CDS:2, partial [Racocetra fulgida]